MRRGSDVSFRSHLGLDIVDHDEASSRRCNWPVDETDLFESPLVCLIDWYVNKTDQFET